MLRYLDPATPVRRSPQPGGRWVAVMLRIEVGGGQMVFCCDSGWVRLVDDQGTEYVPRDVRESGVAEGANLASMNALPRLPGDTAEGVIVFELPGYAMPEKLLFGDASGDSESKGVWLLNDGHTTVP